MNACERLCRLVNPLPVRSYPFSPDEFFTNGIILIYEQGQMWGHGGEKPRIAYVGTHRNGNLANRLSEHFLLDGKKMDFTEDGVAPKDRSILRKTIGRALLNKARDPYLATWNLDFTTRTNRDRYRNSRDVEKEKQIEFEVTEYIRSNFSYCVIPIIEEINRIGVGSITRRIIASVAQCGSCCTTRDWLGTYAPDERIRQFGLWQVQHTRGELLTNDDFELLESIASVLKPPRIS